MKLSDADKKRVALLHADALRRVLAAEKVTEHLTDTAVRQASEALLSDVLGAHGNQAAIQRSAMWAIHSRSESLRLQFANAVRNGRRGARGLAQGQVTTELGAVGAALNARVPAVHQDAEADQLDQFEATRAGNSMASQWGTAALAAVVLWRRSPNQTHVQLARRLGQLPVELDDKVRRHATVQAFDAYSAEQRGAWRATLMAGGEPARALQPGSSSPRPHLTLLEGGSGPEQGLPLGWSAGLFDVWSAKLDRRTCHRCFELDGSMVPTGEEWPGAGRPPAHGLCRCVPVTIFVPAAMSRKLPGIEIDYAALKDDVRDYFRGSTLEGKRHAVEYVHQAFATSSPEVLSRKFLDRRAYMHSPRQRAPKLPPLAGSR